MPNPLTSRPGNALSGRTRAPGDKSISHRSLMLGAVAVGETRVTGLLEGGDVLATAAALRAMGAEAEKLENGIWRVAGKGVGGLLEPKQVLDMGNAGTGARLLMGLIAGHPIRAMMTGDASLRRRPMGRVMGPLEAMGARFDAADGGKMPLTVHGSGQLLPLEYELPVASAQVKSAILLAGLNTAGETTVIEPEPTRDHTENMLRHFGAELRVEDKTDGKRHITLVGQPELTARDVRVPADISSAAFLLVAGLIVPESEVTIEAVGLNPLRAGVLTTLREMGANIAVTNARREGGEPVADLTVKAGPLRAVAVPAGRAPSMIDEYPVLAVAASAAAGVTRMEGLAELRVKESDRLSAVAAGLKACGVGVREGEDWLEVAGTGGGPAPGGADVTVDLDHRIAMSFLVLGLAAQNPVTVDDGGAMDTSFPGFAGLINGLGGDIR